MVPPASTMKCMAGLCSKSFSQCRSLDSASPSVHLAPVSSSTSFGVGLVMYWECTEMLGQTCCGGDGFAPIWARPLPFLRRSCEAQFDELEFRDLLDPADAEYCLCVAAF